MAITPKFNLTALMSANHITIRALAAHMDVTHKRIRAIRKGEAALSSFIIRDYREAVATLAAAGV